MKYSDNAQKREILASRFLEVDELLHRLNQAGFQTNKGSNSHLLANIVVDFVNKVISKRKHDLSILSLWDTQDMNVIVPMIFDRYRIYNERHQPKLYDIGVLDGLDAEQLEFFEPVQNHTRLVLVKSGIAAYAKLHRVTISRLDNEQPTKLGIQYDDLYSGSELSADGEEFFESFMSESGIYQERDFVILPDAKGQALFYPITDFRHAGVSGVLELTLLSKHKAGKPYELELLKDEVIITPDLLRFVLTQLMSRFPIYRGMSKDEFKEFIELKFNVSCIINSNEMVVDATDHIIEDLQAFADRNVFGNVKVTKAGKSTVSVSIEDVTLNQKLQDYLQDKFAEIEPTDKLKEKVYSLVDMFYAVTFGLDAYYAKSQNPATIRVDLDNADFTTVNIAKLQD